MPRYFFHVMDGRANIDIEGCELASISDVRVEAVRLAGAILAQEATGLTHGRPWQMTVANAAGDVVYSLKIEADDRGYEGDVPSDLLTSRRFGRR